MRSKFTALIGAGVAAALSAATMGWLESKRRHRQKVLADLQGGLVRLIERRQDIIRQLRLSGYENPAKKLETDVIRVESAMTANLGRAEVTASKLFGSRSFWDDYFAALKAEIMATLLMNSCLDRLTKQPA